MTRRAVKVNVRGNIFNAKIKVNATLTSLIMAQTIKMSVESRAGYLRFYSHKWWLDSETQMPLYID